MCTLSWKPLDGGYVLLFNRDERRDRRAARPPALRSRHGVRYFAPADGTRGGAWLLANEHGLSVSVLNHYPPMASIPRTHPWSRGWIPLDCADCEDVDAALARVEAMPFEHFPPFHVVVADPERAAMCTWDGFAARTTPLDAAGAMITSSSLRTEDIARLRQDAFARTVGDLATASAERLETFHQSVGDDPAASVRMTRPDACTHSISRITVSLRKAMVRFQYLPLPEIEPNGRAVSLVMPLRAAVQR